MPLQIRRGSEAERGGMVNPLAQGELLYTTDSKKLYVGDGSTLGGVIITGFTEEEAQDSTAKLFLGNDPTGAPDNSIHTNITFSYNDTTGRLSAVANLSLYAGDLDVDGIVTANGFKGSFFGDDSSPIIDGINNIVNANVVGDVTGNITGNLTGNVTGNLTGNVTGNLTGDVTGNLTGNVTGYHYGDVTGSVFSDGSTKLVDAVSGELDGTFVGVVTGTYSGGGIISTNIFSPSITGTNLYADDFTATNSISALSVSSSILEASFIRSPDSSLIQIDNTTLVTQELIVETPDDTRRLASFSQHHDEGGNRQVSPIVIRRTRGSANNPQDVQDRDILGRFEFTGYKDGQYQIAGRITATAAGLGANPYVGAILAFETTNTTTGITDIVAEVDNAQQFNVYSQSATNSPIRLTSAHDTIDTNGMTLRRARGTVLTPAIVQTGDTLQNIYFSGWDGNNLYRTAARVRAVVEGTPATGDIRSRLDLAVRNYTDNTYNIQQVQIKQDKVNVNMMLQIATFANETAATASVIALGAGMMYFDIGASKLKVYDGAAWVAVH
jgi:hypothetical protein